MTLPEFIEKVEGQSLTVYLDSGGAPTIGIGHLLTKSERSSGKIMIGGELIPYAGGLTEIQVDKLLDQDMAGAEQAIRSCVRVPLTDNQRIALTSFVFNVGVSAFQTSTLLKLLNGGHYDQVPSQLARWVHDNGRVVPGLRNRRQAEADLWMADNTQYERLPEVQPEGDSELPF